MRHRSVARLTDVGRIATLKIPTVECTIFTVFHMLAKENSEVCRAYVRLRIWRAKSRENVIGSTSLEDSTLKSKVAWTRYLSWVTRSRRREPCAVLSHRPTNFTFVVPSALSLTTGGATRSIGTSFTGE